MAAELLREIQPDRANPAGFQAPSRVLFLGKRFYTNRDALEERYGRIYQLPAHWATAGVETQLWLVDYHGSEAVHLRHGNMIVSSNPVLRIATWRSILAQLTLRFSHVIASGDCYLGLLGYTIARRAGARFVFDVYDKYDAFPGYRRLPGFDPFSFLLGHADRLLFASQALREQCSRDPAKTLLVPNGLDTLRFRPLDMMACRRKLGLPETPALIGYFGSMETDRGVDDLINAVQRLRAESLNIEILIGGRKRLGLDLSASGIRYVGNISYEQVPLMLSACNVIAVPYRRSEFMDAGASNKIAEALAVGRPIVATRTPNLLANFAKAAEILHDRLADPGNGEEIARVIRAQLEDPILAPIPTDWDWAVIAQDTATRLELLPSPGEGHQ